MTRASGLTLAAVLALALPASAAKLGIEAKPGIEAVANPESGPALRIARVTDRRAFQASAADRWQPIPFEVDPADRAATSRIIARTRGSDLGGRGGNVILAEGATVEAVVGDALTQALRRSGYRVLSSDDPGFSKAAPVEADVTQFWGSLREPRSSGRSYRFEFRLAVRVHAPVVGLRERPTVSVEGFTSRDGRSAVYWSPALRSVFDAFDGAIRERAALPGLR